MAANCQFDIGNSISAPSFYFRRIVTCLMTLKHSHVYTLPIKEVMTILEVDMATCCFYKHVYIKIKSNVITFLFPLKKLISQVFVVVLQAAAAVGQQPGHKFFLCQKPRTRCILRHILTPWSCQGLKVFEDKDKNLRSEDKNKDKDL